MRRILAVTLLSAALAAPALAQARLDLGFFAPRGLGVSGSGDLNTALADWPFIPIPEAGLYYQAELGPIKLGLGGRAVTAIVETIAWPNAFAELDLGPLALEAQMGGGFFAMFGLAGNNAAFGKVFIPDLSAWLKIGKKGILRLGGGVMGVYVPDVLGNTLPFVIYIGGKAAIML